MKALTLCNSAQSNAHLVAECRKAMHRRLDKLLRASGYTSGTFLTLYNRKPQELIKDENTRR